MLLLPRSHGVCVDSLIINKTLVKHQFPMPCLDDMHNTRFFLFFFFNRTNTGLLGSVELDNLEEGVHV